MSGLPFHAEILKRFYRREKPLEPADASLEIQALRSARLKLLPPPRYEADKVVGNESRRQAVENTSREHGRIVIGFSGSRKGMTESQREMLEDHLDGVDVAHHGCCVGADEEFHRACLDRGIKVVGHPAYEVGHPMRADLQGCHLFDITDPLLRNSRIIKMSGFIIAAPAFPEIRRSGTWSTIRKCRKKGKPLVILT